MILQLVLSRIIQTPAASSWHPDNAMESLATYVEHIIKNSKHDISSWMVYWTYWMVEPRVLSPSTAALYPAPQPPTSLLSPSSAWSSAGRLPIIPSYTSQPPLKIFSVLTQKYVIRQNTTAHICFVQNVLPSLTSGVCRRCRSWWSCVKCPPPGLCRQFLTPGEDSDGGEVGRRVNCNGDIVRTLHCITSWLLVK